MKKVLVALLAAVIAAGTATAVSALGGTNEYITVGEITSANYPGSTATGLPEVTSGQLLKGTIIASTNAETESAQKLFDGDASTSYKIGDGGVWVGIELDQAYALTEVRYVPNPAINAGESGWFRLQGSNDSENWADIIIMRQDSHGNDYHIFTPQTVTDQSYIDAGYGVRTDESIHWLDDGGSYKMYRILMHHVGDVEFYGNPAPATELTAEIASNRNYATPYYFPFTVHIRNAEVKNAADGSLVGTIIGGGGVWNKAMWEKAFDNNNKTHFDPSLEGPECWVGMMFDEPHALTEVRLLPKRGCQTDIRYGHFQGSLDGHNWVDLATYSSDDVPNAQDWVIKTITDTKGYTYFRFVSAGDTQSTVSELLLFGAPAEAAEPFTAEPLTATRTKYTGEIFYTDIKNTVTDNEISGTPICGNYFFGWRDSGSGNLGAEGAFDGILAEHSNKFQTIPRLNGSHYWAGLKADEATVVAKVMLGYLSSDKNVYFQGSNDGVNWVDLAVVDPTVDIANEDHWITKEVTDTTAYDFFRLMSDAKDHPDCGFSVSEIKIYAAETAVETAAPETAAPETDAPAVTPVETTPAETSAPETTAPAGTDEPTAPQTFDFGVIAAAAAVVSAAGYALTKKRK